MKTFWLPLAIASAWLLACADPVSAGGASTPDAGTQCAPTLAGAVEGTVRVGQVLPALRFASSDTQAANASTNLHELQEPCAVQGKLLVIRATALWCGTCRWHAAHSALLKRPDVHLVELLVGDEDNNPASSEDISSWRQLLDAPEIATTLVDPDFVLRQVDAEAGLPLPLYLFVDARTLRVLSYAANPNPDELTTRVDQSVATLAGAPAPAPAASTLHDGLFHDDAWDMIADMGRSPAPPPDPTNAVADSASARALGRALFSEVLLSPTGTVSCATCHQAAKGTSDGLAVGKGVAEGSRKTPRITHAAHARWQFWDGRSDSLWSQALGPFENPVEYNSSRLYVLHQVHAHHLAEYNAAFPDSPLPPLTELPMHGKPGDAAYDALSATQRDGITRAFVNLGKAIAAYERSFSAMPTPLQDYARGHLDALTLNQKLGLATFFDAGCAQCHFGPRLTNDAFHTTRVGTGRRDGVADQGRLQGLVALAQGEFLRSSRWSDSAQPPHKVRSQGRALGAFKTPSLLGVAQGAPFGHGGTQSELIKVVDAYGLGGLPTGDARAAGEFEPWLPRFLEATSWAILPFLETLRETPVLP